MQEVCTFIDMSSTTVSTKVENENVDNIAADDEVALNNNISDGSINGSRGSAESIKSSTDSNNSSNRSTPTPPIINDKPKKDEEEEEEDKEDSSTISGGQLKFFKDGQLCLQLAHEQNVGKRSKWIQIRTRTVFPSLVHVSSKEVSIPCQLSPAPNSFSGIATRVETSSTSRSVSDDGSSILSSPILRESSWKQQVPRKGASNILQFFMTPAPCIIRRRKVLYHKFPRLTRRPFHLSWMKKFLSISATTIPPTKVNTSNETGPTQCLECDDCMEKTTVGQKSPSMSVEEEEEVDKEKEEVNKEKEEEKGKEKEEEKEKEKEEEKEKEIPIPLVGSQRKSISKNKKKQLQYCISRLSVKVEKKSPSQVNSDSEQNLANSNGSESQPLQQNFECNKISVKNIQVASLPSASSPYKIRKDLDSCRDLKNNSSTFTIRPKTTEKRSKVVEKDKTILSVPLTAGKRINRLLKADHNLPIDFSKMTESSSSSSSSPSIHHQQHTSDGRDIKSGSSKSKKIKKEKVSSPHQSHSSSNSSPHNSNKNLFSANTSESSALNLSSSNRQGFNDVTPFDLSSLPFANNQLYPLNYLSVLAASSAASSANPSLNSAANFPNYNSANMGLTLQQQLLQQHAMSSVISDTVASLLANKVNNSGSERTHRDSKDSRSNSLNLVQDSHSDSLLLKKMQQHKSKTKKSSNANFKVPEFNANPSSSSSKIKSNSSSKQLYFGNASSGSSSSSQSLLDATFSPSSTSPLSRIHHSLDNNQNSFLRNLLDTCPYQNPIPSNKMEGRDILKSKDVSKAHHLSSKTKIKSNAGGTGSVSAKSQHNSNAKLYQSIPYQQHSTSQSHSKSSSSSSSRSSSKLFSRVNTSSDRDRGGKEKSSPSSLSNPMATNFLSQLSSQRPDHHLHDPMSLLRSSSSASPTSTAAAAAAFHNSLLGGIPGFPTSGASAMAAMANYFKNPPKNDLNSLLGMSNFDYASAFNASQKIPWNSFLPFGANLFDTGAVVGGDAFRLHPAALATTLTSSSPSPSISSDLKYNSDSVLSDAPLNLCKKSRPN